MRVFAAAVVASTALALSPAFQSAQSACQKLLPGGGPGRGQGSEARKLELRGPFTAKEQSSVGWKPQRGRGRGCW